MVHENTATMSMLDETTPDETIPLRDNQEPLIPSRSLSGIPEPPSYSGTGEEGYLYFHIDPKHTNYVNRILEGYEYVGVMTTVNTEGLCMVRTTESTRELAKQILESLPISVTLLD